MAVVIDALMGLKPIGELSGPAENRWAGNLAAFESDRLDFLLRAHAEFGGLARFDARTTIVNDAALVIEILLDRNKSFAVRENFRGEKLNPQRIAETARLRPALNPGMRRAKAGAITPSLVAHWRSELHAVSGCSVDPLPILEQVCAVNIANFYFGEDAHVIVEHVRDLLDALDRHFGNPFSLPASWPTPTRRAIRQRHHVLESALVPLLQKRAHRVERRDEDLTTALVRALAHVKGGPSLERVAQMVIGSLLAAQRVPAAAASWMLYEVAQDLELQEKLQSEAARYAGMISSGATPNANGYPLAMAVVLETLRLHPPTWLLHRSLLRDEHLGGYLVPKGHNILISPYVLHRDETHFENAGAFDIARWRLGQPAPPNYIPFGRGLHGCPGSEVAVAMLVAILLTALHTQAIAVTGGRVTADPRSTLVPTGLELTFQER